MLVAVMTVGAVACATDVTGPVAFEVTTSVSPALARLGDPISVTVTVTNVSTRTRDILTNDCFQAFAVFDSSGAQVGPSARICSLVSYDVTLAPRAQYTVTQEWRGDAVPGAIVAGGLVGPGAYTVTGNLGVGNSVRTTSASVILTP